MGKKSVEAQPVEESKLGAGTGKKGKPTPKRPKQAKPRPPANPPLTYREKRKQLKTEGSKLSKDEKRRAKEDLRAERARISEGQWKGDPLFDKYHLPRDRGPERLLARDIVDSRRSVAQYFFAITMVLLLATNMLPAYVGILMLGWVVILAAFALDSVFLCRKVKRLVWKRYPKTTQKPGGLYWYSVQRAIMFRSMRNPRPRMGYQATEADLGKVVR